MQVRLNQKLLTKLRDPQLNDISHFTKVEIFQLSLYLCSKPSKDRTLRDLQILEKLIENIQFFIDLKESQGVQLIHQCLKCLTIEQYDPQTIIFHKGEAGNKFYIIIQGSVGVYVTDPKRQIRPSMVQIKNPLRLKKLSFMPEKVSYLMSFEEIDQYMMKINEMSEGQAFGELALINDAPRMATVVTYTPAIFAVLQKKDFTQIMKNIQEQKLYEEINKIQKVSGFHSISRRGLNMFIYSFASKDYSIRDFVYHENDPTNDMLYVVRSGQFQISKMFNIRDGEYVSSEMQQLLSLYKSKQQQLKNMQKNFELLVVSEGEIFGDYEVFNKLPNREYSVQCISQKGELYPVPLSEQIMILNIINRFKERIAVSNESFVINLLKKLSSFKSQFYLSRQMKTELIVQQHMHLLCQEHLYKSQLKSLKVVENQQKLFHTEPNEEQVRNYEKKTQSVESLRVTDQQDINQISQNRFKFSPKRQLKISGSSKKQYSNNKIIRAENYSSVVNARESVNDRFGSHSQSLNIYEALKSELNARQQRSRSEYNDIHKFFKIPKYPILMQKIKVLKGKQAIKQKK